MAEKAVSAKSTSLRMTLVFAAVMVAAALFVWFGCRIEPRNGQIAVLIKKTGKTLPPGDIIATSPEYKGIQAEVLGEGRYFRNPYVWEWKIMPITDIPAGKSGILVRKFGKDLPPGEIIARGDDFKGIVREVLGTGKHRINPYAYDVRVYDDIRIMPGSVGVVTNLTGGDVFNGVANDLAEARGFISNPERKGVQSFVLKEGTHRINPFIQSISIVNIQSQRYEFSGADAISFITFDGFTVSMEGTVEFNISENAAPRLIHEVGDMEDIMKKLILPSVNGFARIEGSKKTAIEFIVGESRQMFQDNLQKYLARNCSNWGISINTVLIRDIIPPQDVAQIIRDRELAQQDAKKFTQQIDVAKSEAELAKQEALACQKTAKVAAETEKLTNEIYAKQKQSERLIDAKAWLETAAIELKTAQANAEAVIKLAEADRIVIAAENKADADVIRRTVQALGGGEMYFRAKLYEKLAPKINSIMTNAPQKGTVFGLPVAPEAK